MDNPNRMALDLVDEAIDFADELNVGVSHLENEAAVLDFGVDEPGGIEAGLLLAEVATGGLATVQARVGTVAGAALTHVELSTDHPTLSLLGCQMPGWEFEVGDSRARGCGPAQLFRRRGGDADGLDAVSGDLGPEEVFDHIDYEEQFDFAVLAVESDRLPDESMVRDVASVAGVPTSGVFALVAPAKSVAGSVAFAARAAERAVRRLATVGYDVRDVRSVDAVAPAAPLSGTESGARARSAAAIAAGGRVHLVVEAAVDDPRQLVRPESDVDLPAPAQVTVDVAGGPTHVVGGVEEDVLAEDLDLDLDPSPNVDRDRDLDRGV